MHAYGRSVTWRERLRVVGLYLGLLETPEAAQRRREVGRKQVFLETLPFALAAAAAVVISDRLTSSRWSMVLVGLALSVAFLSLAFWMQRLTTARRQGKAQGKPTTSVEE